MTRTRLQLIGLERRVVPTTVTEVEPNNLVFFPNDIPVATGDVLITAPDDWLTVQAVVDTLADRDYFRFTLTAASGVFLNLNSRDTGLSSVLNAVLDIYDTTGTTLLGSSDEGYDFESYFPPITGVAAATSPDPSLYVDLAAGTYMARVMSFQSASFGAYQLRMLADSLYSLAVPTIASLPAAPVNLYLDFDGHSASDDWGSYNAAAFDLAGQPSTFSPGEKYAIRNIWRIVSEDFAPFAVNVTTIEPASFADGAGFRLVVTSSVGSIVSQSASARGIAIAGSFGGLGVNTGFVFQPGFSDYQGGVSGRIVAAALEQGNEAAQSLGRALGLRYYGGVNGQPSGIMQDPDSGLNRSTWSMGLTHSGEFPVTMQDDAAIITSAANGISYLPDDHGDTIATATAMSSSSINGVISSATDRDIFGFAVQQGNSIINVKSHGFSGDIDAELRVYNAAGQLLASVAPDDSFDANVTVYSSTVGQFYAEVRGSNVAGAIGTYGLDVSFAPVTGPGQVVTTIINGGAVQRSMVTDLNVRFSRPMSFPNGVAAAFAVTGTNGAVPIDVDLSTSNPSQTIAIVRFPNGTGGFGSIADGNFQLSIIAAYSLDDANQQLDGDSNGLPGGNYNYGFFRLFGDQDGDRSVAIADFNLFRGAFGGNLASFDYDGDGSVSGSDFNQFRSHFGSSI